MNIHLSLDETLENMFNVSNNFIAIPKARSRNHPVYGSQNDIIC